MMLKDVNQDFVEYKNAFKKFYKLLIFIILQLYKKVFDSGYQILEFVIETEDKYPQKVKMQVTKDRVALMEEIPIGTNMVFSFNIRGREWVNDKKETRYFVSLDVWRTEILEVDLEPSETHSTEDSLPF